MDLLEALFEQDIWENVIDKGADKTIPLSVLRKWYHVDKRLELDRKSTRLNSSHANESRMPSSA